MDDTEDLSEEVMNLLSLCPEDDSGNVEYNRQLKNPSKKTLEKKSTQMQFRMKQGNGECIYIIGVNDDGSPCGQNIEEQELTIEILQKIADMNDYSLKIMDTRIFKDRTIQRIFIRENNITQYRELRIGVTGRVDAGKSSLVGTLSTGEMDDGNGKTRTYALHFKHEIETGRTSSISQQIVGYDLEGKHIPMHNDLKKFTWQELTSKSAKIVTLFDLAGHASYSHTTYKGISSNHLDYIFVIVAANMGITSKDMTIEHIRMSMAHRIPLIFIISKMDLVEDKPKILEETINSIYKVFARGFKKKFLMINDIGDVLTAVENCNKGNYIPMFKISIVKNTGLDILHEFLNLCPPRHTFDHEAPVEFEVADTYMVGGVGIIIGGFLSKGTIKIGEMYYLGPDKNQNFQEVKVRTIQVKRKNTNEARAGKYVCLGIPKIKRKDIKGGMVIVKLKPKAVTKFSGEIFVHEHHHTTVKVGYTPLLILRSYRSAVKITEINCEENVNIRNSKESAPRGKKINAQFELVYRPCFLSKDDRIILVEGTLRIVGKITDII